MVRYTRDQFRTGPKDSVAVLERIVVNRFQISLELVFKDGVVVF